VGMDVAQILGITHYEPPEDPQQTGGDNEFGPGHKQSKIFPRSLKGWLYFLVRVFTFGFYDLNGNVGGANQKAPDAFRPIYDVEAFKNFANVLQPGEEVLVTEKIHGSNARYTFDEGKQFAGSRKLWKSPKSNCIWRKLLAQSTQSWMLEWMKQNPGVTIYGEVAPTQAGFDYGCTDGRVKFFIFDILDVAGEFLPFDTASQLFLDCGAVGEILMLGEWVPILYRGPFDLEKILSLVDGPSMVHGAKHMREGIVIRPIVEREARNLGRVQLKIVSNKFLEKDSK